MRYFRHDIGIVFYILYTPVVHWLSTSFCKCVRLNSFTRSLLGTPKSG